MSHVRQQMREQIAAAVTGLSLTGTNVYQSRVYPVENANLPCLIVTTEGDSAQMLTMSSPASIMRSVIVRIQAIARAVADLDDTMDSICADIETAIGNASTIALNIEYQGTEIELTAIGEKPVGTATLTYIAQINTLENAPETAL